MDAFVTLNILQERLIRKLSGGDVPNDSPYDPAFAIEVIRDAMNEELKREILTRRSGDSDDKSAVSQYIYSYTVPVTIDTATRRAKAALPSYFLSLKYNKGIRAVIPLTQSSDILKSMIRIDNPGITSRLPHGDLEQYNQGYYVEGMTIYFMRDIKRDNINQVYIKLLIAAPLTLGWDDPLPLTPESLGRIMDVAEQRMMERVPQDRIADENPNLRSTNEARK